MGLEIMFIARNLMGEETKYYSEEEYNEYKDTFVTDENIELVSLNRRNFSLKKGNQN